MRNNTGVFNSQNYINEYVRDVRSALYSALVAAPKLSDESMAILAAAQRAVAEFHEQSPTREQVIELLDELKCDEVVYPAPLLAARRNLFVVQIKIKAGSIAVEPAGS